MAPLALTTARHAAVGPPTKGGCAGKCCMTDAGQKVNSRSIESLGQLVYQTNYNRLLPLLPRRWRVFRKNFSSSVFTSLDFSCWHQWPVSGRKMHWQSEVMRWTMPLHLSTPPEPITTMSSVPAMKRAGCEILVFLKGCISM